MDFATQFGVLIVEVGINYKEGQQDYRATSILHKHIAKMILNKIQTLAINMPF